MSREPELFAGWPSAPVQRHAPAPAGRRAELRSTAAPAAPSPGRHPGNPVMDQVNQPAAAMPGRVRDPDLDHRDELGAQRVAADDPAFAEAWHRLDPDPARIACRSYSEHRSAHRWIDGTGWICDVCQPSAPAPIDASASARGSRP
jgi:hypothetical protein